MKIITVLSRFFFFYGISYLFYRKLAKREVEKLRVSDFVVLLLAIDFVSWGIEDYSNSLFLSLLPTALLLLIQIGRIKLKRINKVIDSEAVVIINRGKVNFKEMLEQKYSLEDLLSDLREKDVKSIEEVDYAILEASGKLTVFLREENDTYPLPIILDGKIDEEVLLQIGKNKEWLVKCLAEENYLLENVFYGFYRNGEMFLIKKDLV